MNPRQHFLNVLRVLSVRVSPINQPFTLASGEKSRFYIDVKQTALHKSMQLTLATLLCNEFIEFYGACAVAGVALGGCHLASLAGYESAQRGRPVSILHIRKEAKDHGTKSLIEGPRNVDHDPVVLFEDVITTGGSSLKAVAALRAADYEVLGIVAVVDRRVNRTPTLEGVPLRALYTLDDFSDLDDNE